MIRKHKIYYLLWRVLVFVKGVRIGTIVKEYSTDKNKFIKGCVTSFTGDSISNGDYSFTIGINWFEPHQGIDTRFFMWGAYYIEQFKGDEIINRPNKSNKKTQFDSYR